MSLLAFGSNGSGQLGIGHLEDVSTPTQCLFDATTPPASEITTIAAGGNHTLLLTKAGHVYAAGCNDDNRCGAVTEPNTSEENEPMLRFRRIVLTEPASGSRIESFKAVSATWEGTILAASVPCSGTSIKTENRVFVLGSTPKGELGLGESQQIPAPGTSIPSFPPEGLEIIALASGMGHSVAVLSSGEVYGWGGARKGQLGEGLKKQKIVWTPQVVEGVPFKATGAVCGREFTVILGEKARGEFVVLGDPANRWGVLNVPGLRGNVGSPREFVDIGASWHGVYVQIPKAETGANVVAWGRNDRGQLPPDNIPHVRKIAVGSEHALALLQDGSVVAFGWGEHGNCGPHTDERGNVAGVYKIIPLPDVGNQTVVGLGAGCATSWIMLE